MLKIRAVSLEGGAAFDLSPQSLKPYRAARVFFFVVAPFCSCPASLVSRKFFAVGPGCAKCFFFVALRWAVFFFLLWPRAGAQRGFSFPCLSPGPEQKKNTLGGVFFLLWPRAGAPTGLLLPLPFPGAGAKKNWVVFFFCCGPALTAGLGGDASPSPGWCFFLLRPRPDRAGVFFFAVAPPGRSLTHCGLGRFRQGPGGVFFFLLRPRRVF